METSESSLSRFVFSIRKGHPERDISENVLQDEGILALLAVKPDMYEWKTFSENDF